jgi:hypothetical protein
MLSKEQIDHHRFEVNENATEAQHALRAIWMKNLSHRKCYFSTHWNVVSSAQCGRILTTCKAEESLDDSIESLDDSIDLLRVSLQGREHIPYAC